MVYKEWKRSIRNITVSSLVKVIEEKYICSGVENKSFSGKLINHSVPYIRSVSSDDYDDNEDRAILPFKSMNYCRTYGCEVLASTTKCPPCSMYDKAESTKEKRTTKRKLEPCASKAPISCTSIDRIKANVKFQKQTIKTTELRCQQLEEELERMKVLLQKQSVQINEGLSSDLIEIIGKEGKTTPFMDLFWQQQKKMFSRSPRGVRFHPAIIRFALSLCIKSPSAYEELQKSGVIRLPSQRTLASYKNYIRPQPGFSRQVLDELIRATKDFSGFKRFIAMLFDEMKVKSNLVFDKHNGDMIGFLDLGDLEINLATLEQEDDLATHILVFFLRGLAINLKFSLAYFSTNTANCEQLFHLFWEAVDLLENMCKLKLISATSDGASSNRNFFKMCAAMDTANTMDIGYKTINIYAPERYIYLFSDAPHLIKTARN